jgi:hypothetical protein
MRRIQEAFLAEDYGLATLTGESGGPPATAANA